MRKKTVIFLIIFILVGLVVRRALLQRWHRPIGSLFPSTSTPTTNPTVTTSGITIKEITGKGGRVAWYKGAKHDLVAFDAIANEFNKNSQMYTMNPDGSNRQCVTCSASAIPQGFTGQPEWHPDGEHLVFQAENNNSKHGVYNHMSFGIDEDLWVIGKDGSNPQKIWESAPLHGALHPHFNNDGTLLIFSERIPTGKSNPAWLKLTPGGENPWDGWQIHIASVDLTKSGTAILSNHRVLKPSGSGLYEVHNFHGDKIVYSFTANGQAFVDDIHQANLDGSNVENLTQSPTTWEEHGIFSSSGRSMAFISSRADTLWVAPTSKANTLKTELFEKSGGEIKQLTNFNASSSRTRYLISDYDWNAVGNQIMFQVAPVEGARALDPQIWLLTFPASQ